MSKDPGPVLDKTPPRQPATPIMERMPIPAVKPGIEPDRFTTQGDFSTKFNIPGHK